MPVVGFLGSESPVRWATYVRAFQQGLREVGYVEGSNVAIEYRWAEGQNERMSGLLADLLRRPVSALAVPGSTPAALAAKAATTTVPIVFAIAADPVQIGLVTSLNRPGGNVTGVVTLNIEIAPKRLELLHELFPTATSFALLVNPANPSLAEPVSRHVQTAWPLAASAQQPQQIGMLLTVQESDPATQGSIGVFQRRLRELGWVVTGSWPVTRGQIPIVFVFQF
jgi:putative tryptophan/tyrosine transport system substrate-binding protein